ncbi:MAG TPA: DUF1800 domain-containing protein [Chloroflexota bacterium]|jgi:uncharacterized protein (DUF1800 family)|nr:DUF1800 domain-containing protein [Chloroflexota bacterium]
MALTERQLIAHLLRRAGFGATPAELDYAVGLGFDGLLDRLLDYGSVDMTQFEADLAARNDDLSRLDGVQRWWLYRMRFSPRPLEEKMTLFWHGHFASTNQKVEKPPYMLIQNRLFRANALGGFAELVLKVSQDPAMLVFLDGKDNGKRRPNENYARELFELFTLGIGNYTEQDIKESARAFTGWTIRNDRFFDDVANHDTGVKTVLGQTGNWNGADVCRIAVEHPACAPFIARKLIRFFVTDTPTQELVQPVADAFRSSGLSVRAALETIFRSAEFRDEAHVRSLIKSPSEFLVGAMRHLDVAVLPNDFPNVLRQMQQELFNPPGVEGWKGGRVWLSSTTYLHRANFVNRLASGSDPNRQRFVDPAGLLNGLTDDRAIVDHLVERLLDGDMSAEGRQAIVGWLAQSTSRTRTRRLRGAIHLVMTTSTYQLD